MLVCNIRNLCELLSRWKVFCALLCSRTVSMNAQHRYPDVYPDVTQTHRSNSSFVTNWGISGSEPSLYMDQGVEPGHHQELEETLMHLCDAGTEPCA